MSYEQRNSPPDFIGTFLGGCLTLVFIAFMLAGIIAFGEWFIGLF